MMLETANRVPEEPKTEASDDAHSDWPAAEPLPAHPDAAESATDGARELLTPQLLSGLRKVVPAIWLLGVFATGAIAGVQLAFLALAAGVLALVITLMWFSVQSLTGSSSLGFEEALGMGAPSRVEEEKRAVLRALKDLEYERGVGKISPQDYAELSARYRAEAKRLIQSVDEALGPARDEVEKAIAQRLRRAGISEPRESSTKLEMQAATKKPAAMADTSTPGEDGP